MKLSASLALFGPPGAGKGTQAQRLSKALRVPHISTGDILRQVRVEGGPLGVEVNEIMRRGDLVPDTLVVNIVEARLAQSDCDTGFILDGFPRTPLQAQALDHILDEQGKTLDVVIRLDVNEAELVSRLAGRRTCPRCGRAYHLRFNPPLSDSLCDDCPNQPLQVREDDREETVRDRLRIYQVETAPVIDYYEKRGLLKHVNGHVPPDEVFACILSLL